MIRITIEDTVAGTSHVEEADNLIFVTGSIHGAKRIGMLGVGDEEQISCNAVEIIIRSLFRHNNEDLRYCLDIVSAIYDRLLHTLMHIRIKDISDPEETGCSTGEFTCWLEEMDGSPEMDDTDKKAIPWFLKPFW